MKSETKIGVIVVLLLVAVVGVLLAKEIMSRRALPPADPLAADGETDQPFASPESAQRVVDGVKDDLARGVQPAPAPSGRDLLAHEPPALPAVAVPPAPALPGAQEYVVKRGDLLSTIARQFYGRTSQWKRIADANPGVNPNNLKVGTRLMIPEAPAAPAPLVSLPVAAPAVAGGQTYTVRRGDTLGRIARRFYGKETRWTLLVDANPGVNPNNLKVGAVLNIPEGAGMAPAAAEAPAGRRSARPWEEHGATRLVTPAR